MNKVVLPRLNKQSGKAISSQPSMDTTVDTLAFRPKCRGLDKFNQDVLRKTIFDLHNERIMPTLDKILSRVEGSIIISKSSLAVAFRKRGKKHYVKENQQITADRCF